MDLIINQDKVPYHDSKIENYLLQINNFKVNYIRSAEPKVLPEYDSFL